MDAAPRADPQPPGLFPRQPYHPHLAWAYDLSDLTSIETPVPEGHDRLVTFVDRAMIRTQRSPGSAAPRLEEVPEPGPADAGEATLMRLKRPPASWSELSSCSAEMTPANPSQGLQMHSGLDPKRPWCSAREEVKSFFEKLARNDVTRIRGAVQKPNERKDSSSDTIQLRPTKRLRPTVMSKDAPAGVRLATLLGSATIGEAASSTSPLLSAELLTHLGEDAWLDHLRSLFVRPSTPFDILLVNPPRSRSEALPVTTPLRWARPLRKRLQDLQRGEPDRQAQLRETWIPVLNALLREALLGRASENASNQGSAESDDGAQLFWARQTDMATILPSRSSGGILLRSKGGSQSSKSSKARHDKQSISVGTNSGPIGLADFYLLYRRDRQAQLRIAAVLEMKPFVQLSFLAHALLCTLGGVRSSWTSSTDPCHTLDAGANQNVSQQRADSLVTQLLNQMCASAAPLSILMTTFQLLVIERKDADVVFDPTQPAGVTSADLDTKLYLTVHDTVYAPPFPESLQMMSIAREAVQSRCPVANSDEAAFKIDSSEHLIARLVELSLRAAQRCDAPAQQAKLRFKPFWHTAGQGQGGPGQGRRADEDMDESGLGSGPGPGGSGNEGGGRGGQQATSGVQETDVDLSATTARDQAQDRGLSRGHRIQGSLFYRVPHFARGADATVHLGCITKPGTPGCHFISIPGALDECERREDHQLCIVKCPPALFFDDDDEYEVENFQELYQIRCERLRKEADAYLSLASLQGQVIPRYYGAHFGPGPVIPAYAFEDAAPSLNDQEGLEDLDLTNDEIDEIAAAMLELLRCLHLKGFAHRDVALRNFCVARSSASVVPNEQGTEPPGEARSRIPSSSESVMAPPPRPQDPPASPRVGSSSAAPSTPAPTTWTHSSAQHPPTPATTVSSGGSGSRGSGSRDVGDSSLESTSTAQPEQSDRGGTNRNSGIQLRLIDLSRACDLRGMPQEEVDRLIRKDLRRVEEAVAEFRYLASFLS